MSKVLSDKDKRDWETFLESKEKLPDKDFNKKNIKTIDIRTLDLHGVSLDDANKIVESFVKKSFKDGVKKLRIVTGKGIHSNNESDPFVSKDLSILRYTVPEFIKNNKELSKKINEIKEADFNDGGSGAFYLYLKKQGK